MGVGGYIEEKACDSLPHGVSGIPSLQASDWLHLLGRKRSNYVSRLGVTASLGLKSMGSLPLDWWLLLHYFARPERLPSRLEEVATLLLRDWSVSSSGIG